MCSRIAIYKRTSRDLGIDGVTSGASSRLHYTIECSVGYYVQDGVLSVEVLLEEL